MGKLFWISTISFLIISCVTREKLVYFDENGECYPTDFNIQKMIDKKNLTGLDYVWYDCQWLTHNHRDSLFQIKYDKVWRELIQEYDSINHPPVYNHQ